MADQTCPPIPAGGVEINALHEAAVKGKDLNEVIAAQSAPEQPATDPEPPAGKPDPKAARGSSAPPTPPDTPPTTEGETQTA